MIAHRDEVESGRAEAEHLGGLWTGCYYPRSNKIYFRGPGLIDRLDDLDYDDGEPR